MSTSKVAVVSASAKVESFTPIPRRPSLIWQGRSRSRVAEPVPAQTLEIIRPARDQFSTQRGLATTPLLTVPSEVPQNRLIWTNDNLVALTSLLAGDDQHKPLEGEVDLIYIDPPFAVQNNFSVNVEIEDGVSDEKLPTLIEQLAYEDTWKDGLDSYLSMMRDRLELLKRLLKPTGSIYVHCDWHAGHYLKVLMDEVFGYDHMRNEIVWKRTSAHSDVRQGAKQFGRAHDVLLWYSASGNYTFNVLFESYTAGYEDKHYGQVDSNGRRYKTTDLTAAKPGGDTSYEWKGVRPPSGRYWAYSKANMEEFERQGRLYYTSTGFPRLKQYLDEMPGLPLPDLWDTVFPVNSQAAERINFPTQKPLALLQRIIAANSNPGDLVLDCFAGSGTTAVAAETMKDADGKPGPRRWIAIDCGKFAVHISRKRLIEAAASPFTVENIGYYNRADWQSLLAKRPSARVYRDALVQIYGGEPVEGFTYLHGRKGAHWVHVGPLDAPITEAELGPILAEAATTTLRAVDVLSADIPVDWNPNAVEYQYGVTVHPKIIPQAAVDAVRDRMRRRRRKDPDLDEAPQIHFFSPPDVEIAVVPRPGGVTIKLSRLTVDLDDCLSTQDERKRGQIKAAITDWTALVDYWAVDWDWQEGQPFENHWQTFRTRKQRELQLNTTYTYPPNERGEKRIAVKVTDIFGNDGLKVVRVTV